MVRRVQSRLRRRRRRRGRRNNGNIGGVAVGVGDRQRRPCLLLVNLPSRDCEYAVLLFDRDCQRIALAVIAHIGGRSRVFLHSVLIGARFAERHLPLRCRSRRPCFLLFCLRKAERYLLISAACRNRSRADESVAVHGRRRALVRRHGQLKFLGKVLRIVSGERLIEDMRPFTIRVIKIEGDRVRHTFDADLGVVRRPTVAVPVEGQLKLDPFLFRGRICMPAARIRVVFFNIRRLVDRHAADKCAIPLFRRGGHDRISGQLIRSFLVRSLRHARYVDLSAVGDGNEEKLLCLRI